MSRRQSNQIVKNVKVNDFFICICECADIIPGLLCDLFNKSLMSGIFPDDWKCATVTPLFKQGKSFDLNNY